jgi:hypothetical protein
MTRPWKNQGRRAVINAASVPAPIGGLNSRDSVAAMPITDALILRNWFPFPYAVSMRKGWKEYVVGLAPGATPSITMHSPKTGAPIPIVFSGGNVYKITVPGPAPAPSVSGMLNDYWQSVMFSNIGGNYVYSVNGADNPLVFDGVTFTPVLFDATPPPVGFDISGVDPKLFIHVAIHQRRLWFVEKDSTQAWFLPVDRIGGIASPFPVGQLFKFGGFLMAIYTWAGDSGDGMNDKLVFISSNGEIAVYAGTDPDDPTAWGLEGVIRVGSPVGRRCAVEYGGDLLLITTDGLIPLSGSFQSTKVNTADNLTDKIQHTISALVSSYRDLVGWEAMLFQNENQIWLVVPVPTGVEIYTMNTITGAWAQFTNMDVRDVCLFNANPIYVTSDGRVCLAWTGYFDNVPWDGLIGERIEVEVLTAYNYFEMLGVTKRWTLCRPIFQSGTVPPNAIRLEVDFAVVAPLAIAVVPPPATDFVWDLALWDEATWNQEYTRFRRWQSIEGMGYAAALHMVVAQDVETLWVATDFVFEHGATV